VLDGSPPHIINLKRQSLPDFSQGLVLYRQKKFTDAKQSFRQVLHINEQDKAAALYVKRCEQFQKYGVPEEWEGVEVLDEK
jgi:two-component system sensor histidine kinase ChiS